jgi:hypothetical protein
MYALRDIIEDKNSYITLNETTRLKTGYRE